LNNPWKFVLLKLYWFIFHFIFWSLVIACLFVSLFVICHIGNWKRGLAPSIEEFESISKRPTTLRAIGLRSTPNWVKHQRESSHQNWGLFCNFVIDNLLVIGHLYVLPSLLSNFVTKMSFIGSVLGASNRLPYFHLEVIILGNFSLMIVSVLLGTLNVVIRTLLGSA